ncbi:MULTISPECIES: hypothetical protein [Bacillus cereus group]|nr:MULTISPECIES: hypothetical protein [Bacillus cereus group]EJR26240.1 hypothetical protein IIE_06086 [Bacillus cereus VD045]MEB8990679.1 hypothetical protein [Bacillus cereus]MEB9179457.1 hypothetical protein [Bacillus cereus]
MKRLSGEVYQDDDPLAFAKGCKNGLIIALPFWGVVIGLVSFIM